MSVYRKPLKALSTLFDDGAKRTGKARGKIKKGTYGAADLAADVLGAWFDAARAWMDVNSGSSGTPTCFIKGAAGSKPNNFLLLTDAIKTMPSEPDLVGVKADGSGVEVIKKAKVTFAFVDPDAQDEIQVTVDLGTAAAGLYQGLVYDGNELLGTIVVQVT